MIDEANDACFIVRDKNGQEAGRSTEATLFLATSADGRNWVRAADEGLHKVQLDDICASENV